MKEALPNDYGQPGEANYDIDRHEWLFGRNIGRKDPLHILDGPNPTLASDSGGVPWNTSWSARARSQAVRKVSSTYPEFTAAASLLSSHLQSSESVERLVTAYDALESDLVAFGYATDIDRSSTRQHLCRIPIGVTPGGLAKDSVIFVRLNEEQLDWQDENFKLNLATLKGGERTTWQGQRGPIKQLRLSPTIPGSRTWLAVRFLRATVFLQPCFHLNHLKANTIWPPEYEATTNESLRIEPSETLVLSMEQTGGASHSDVAFNTFIPTQFAVLDQQGLWSIWTAELRRQGGQPWALRLWKSGQIERSQGHITGSSNVFQDGFGRIGWVRDSSTLYTASRTSFALFDVGDNIKRLVVPNIIAIENAEHILDVREDPVDTSFVYVVTSTRIICLNIYTKPNSAGVEMSGGARILLSWRHFRNSEDPSLRISICRTIYSTKLILSSPLTGLTSVNTVFGSPSESTLTLCLSDVCFFALDEMKGDIIRATTEAASPGHNQPSMLSLTLKELPYKAVEDGASNNFASRCLENRISFYQLIILDGDSRVHEYLLTDHTGWTIQKPSTRRLITGLKSSARVAPEYFVVPSINKDPQLDLRLADTRSNFRNSSCHLSKDTKMPDPSQDQWTLNVEWLQHDLQAAREADCRTFEEALAIVSSRMHQCPNDMRVVTKSLFELLDYDVVVGDIDAASINLKETLRSFTQGSISQEPDSLNQDPNILLEVFTSSLCRSLGIGEIVDMARLYDHVVRFWVSPLPSQSPARLRLLTEQLARKIAAQLSFASYRVVPRNTRKNSFDIHQGSQYQHRNDSMLRRGHLAISSSQQDTEMTDAVPDAVEYAVESPPLTRPTPQHTPWLRPRRSTSSTLTVERLTSIRIRSHVSHMVPQMDSDPAVSRILTHWDEGVDPGAYDWEETARIMVTAERIAETDDPSQKKKKRRAEKQRKEVQEAAAGPSSQPAPRVANNSQSQGTQLSTQAAQPITMSQVVPGLHGSRKMLAKKARPKRKAGF